MTNKQIKIKFIEDCPEVGLTLWALKEELSKDNTFIFVQTIEEADLVVASRHYFIQDELDKIQGRKLIWINYGATLKSYTNVPLTKTKDHHSYDASEKMWLFVGLSPNYKEALNNYKLDTNRVQFLGYPKMDLINYNYGVTIKDMGVNPNNKTILYTPTLGWKTCTCQSSFFDYINRLVYWSLEYNFNLIIRPHPYFLKQFPEAQALLDNINKLDNVKVDSSYNYYVIFKLVDFIISDVSSLAYEFLITTKPVVLTRTSFKKEELFQDYVENNIMYEVKNSNELENRIRLLLNNEDEFKNRRITFVNDLPKNSSKLIKDYIKENYK
jgi:CDP-glycerol glycerophosphotransferase (TagB/SpsB family)